MISYEKFISEYKEHIKHRCVKLRNQYKEQALLSLLEDNKECKELWECSPDAGEFQKMLRITDVNDQVGVDMAIWNLIHASDLFWDVVAGKDIWDCDF